MKAYVKLCQPINREIPQVKHCNIEAAVGRKVKKQPPKKETGKRKRGSMLGPNDLSVIVGDLEYAYLNVEQHWLLRQLPHGAEPTRIMMLI